MPTCPECHSEISPTEWAETGRCSVCGYSFAEHTTATPKAAQSIPTQPKAPSNANTNRIIIGACLGLLVVVFAVAYPYLFHAQPSLHNFRINVASDTCWSGSLGGIKGQTTYDGCNNSEWTGMDQHTAAVFQKTTDTGYLTLTITQDGNTCYSSTTTAAYGLVSGTC